MSRHTASVRWARGDAAFTDLRYSRRHTWHFDGGIDVPASSSPHSVKVPYSAEDAVDPEEAFVASIASCHMLWFLSIAAERGFVVERYVDDAEGFLERGADGKVWMSATLRPAIAFGARKPSRDELAGMHDDAHHACFIANSVKTIVTCEPGELRD
ncbi:MAG TPA: OsmC family protein [Casimicrobiaceae bacterium]